MMRRARSGCYKFSDFLELVQEDQKADLIDGAIIMASPESIEHNHLVAWLHKLLGLYVEEFGLGDVTINKVAYRLSDLTAPEPDLAFVCTKRLGIMKHGYVDGPPDLAVEIVSPDSVHRDYEDKRVRYEEAGVGEYWIIDPDERAATFLVRDSRGGSSGTGFTEAVVEGGVFRSRVVSGFEIEVSWLWQRPLPPTLPIVQGMLAKIQGEK